MTNTLNFHWIQMQYLWASSCLGITGDTDFTVFLKCKQTLGLPRDTVPIGCLRPWLAGMDSGRSKGPGPSPSEPQLPALLHASHFLLESRVPGPHELQQSFQL